MTFNNTTIPNNLYPVTNGTVSSNPFVYAFEARDPTIYDVPYPIQKPWLNTSTNNFWFLKNFTTSSGQTFANWIEIRGASTVETVTGDDGIVVDSVNNNINFLGNVVANGTHAKPIFFRSGGSPNEELDVQLTVASASSVTNNAGVASFNSNNFSVDSHGYVSALGFAFNYTNVTHAQSPYTVLSTDYYISVDCSGGVVTLKFPNAPPFKQLWVVKDRTGNASPNNITLTTVGGAVDIDGATSYLLTSNFGAVNLLFNGTSYEVY